MSETITTQWEVSITMPEDAPPCCCGEVSSGPCDFPETLYLRLNIAIGTPCEASACVPMYQDIWGPPIWSWATEVDAFYFDDITNFSLTTARLYCTEDGLTLGMSGAGAFYDFGAPTVFSPPSTMYWGTTTFPDVFCKWTMETGGCDFTISDSAC